MRSVIIAAAFTAIVAVSPARAIEINFGAVLSDMDGQPIKDGDKVMTLGRAAMFALMNPQPDEANQAAEEKFRKGALALRVYTSDKVDLSAEDVVLIKKYIGKTYGPLVVVRAFPLLDGSGR